MPETVTGSIKKAVQAAAATAAREADSGITQGITQNERRRMIAEAAYYHAEQRGFGADGAEHDWLMAEQEIDELLARKTPGRKRQSRH